MAKWRAPAAICAGLLIFIVWLYYPTQRSASHQRDGGYDSQARSPSYPPATWGDDPDSSRATVVDKSTIALREHRQVIVDSPDLLASLSSVSFNSGTVEKVAAAEVLLVCSSRRAETSDSANSRMSSASAELARRCGALTVTCLGFFEPFITGGRLGWLRGDAAA